MNDDKDLKSTLNDVVSYAVRRMESESDINVRRCIFQEYREWLGTGAALNSVEIAEAYIKNK